MIPGRIRSNGQPVPVQAADYAKYRRGAGAGRKGVPESRVEKNKDAVSNCTDRLSQACDNCHKVYRDSPQK